MRTLLVTPYAPARDGIAAYAVQLARQMRRDGDEVVVLSPAPSAAHLHLDYAGPRGSAALAKRVRRFDRVVLQYHPMFHYDTHTVARRNATDLILGEAMRLANESVAYVHEVEYEDFKRTPARRAAGEFFWSGFDVLIFHSSAELENFREVFPRAAVRATVSPHGESFFRRTELDQQAARRSLGVSESDVMFLSIGFIQRHKGFDRAVHGFAGLETYGARLDIVGSVRTDDPEFLRYLDELRIAVDETSGVHLHEGYTSDEMFDRWISACDVVVLPYREIWSSGVLERAKLYNKRVIASRVGGLAEQADPTRTTLISSDEELRLAMAEAAGGPPVALADEAWHIDEDTPWTEIQGELERRAVEASGVRVMPVAGEKSRPRARPSSISAPIRNLPHYNAPAPTSSRPGVTPLKRIVGRAVGWRVDPLARQVEMMRAALVTSVADIEQRLAQSEGSRRSALPEDALSPSFAAEAVPITTEAVPTTTESGSS